MDSGAAVVVVDDGAGAGTAADGAGSGAAAAGSGAAAAPRGSAGTASPYEYDVCSAGCSTCHTWARTEEREEAACLEVIFLLLFTFHIKVIRLRDSHLNIHLS